MRTELSCPRRPSLRFSMTATLVPPPPTGNPGSSERRADLGLGEAVVDQRVAVPRRPRSGPGGLVLRLDGCLDRLAPREPPLPVDPPRHADGVRDQVLVVDVDELRRV